MKKEALEFMIRNKLDKCYECAGRIFKHEHNAKDMDAATGKQGITIHEREGLAEELGSAEKTE